MRFWWYVLGTAWCLKPGWQLFPSTAWLLRKRQSADGEERERGYVGYFSPSVECHCQNLNNNLHKYHIKSNAVRWTYTTNGDIFFRNYHIKLILLANYLLAIMMTIIVMYYNGGKFVERRGCDWTQHSAGDSHGNGHAFFPPAVRDPQET